MNTNGEFTMPNNTDPYLAKARELCPQKKEWKELIGWPLGWNDCLSLCLPIVAEQLKLIDLLKEDSKRLVATAQNAHELKSKLETQVAQD